MGAHAWRKGQALARGLLGPPPTLPRLQSTAASGETAHAEDTGTCASASGPTLLCWGLWGLWGLWGRGQAPRRWGRRWHWVPEQLSVPVTCQTPYEPATNGGLWETVMFKGLRAGFLSPRGPFGPGRQGMASRAFQTPGRRGSCNGPAHPACAVFTRLPGGASSHPDGAPAPGGF